MKDVQQAIDEIVASDGEVLVPVAAAKLVKRYERTGSAMMEAWLWENAERFVALDIQQRMAGRRRSATSRHRGAEAFGQWAERFEAGESDEGEASPFEISYAVDLLGTHKPLGEMLRPDCLFVVDDREKRTVAMAFDIALMRALAKRLPDDETPVAAVVSTEQLAVLLAGKEPSLAIAA